MVTNNSLVSLVSGVEIAAFLPHGENMCLLDGVQQWDADSIVALSFSHHLETNPLLERGNLGAATLVEYAAQAAAVHAGLTDTGLVGDQAAFMGAIKGLKLYQQTVPKAASTLFCERSEEHTSELQSRSDLVCRLLLEKKKRYYFK